MNYRALYLFIFVFGSIIIPVSASNTTYKVVQEKLSALKLGAQEQLQTIKAGAQEHQAALLLLTAAAAYGTYKKSETVQASVQNGWKKMKEKSDQLFEQYNQPATAGFLTRLSCLLVGGKLAVDKIGTVDKQVVADKLAKSIEPLRAAATEVKNRFNALSMGKKIATSIGLAAVISGGGYLVNKVRARFAHKDPKTAFIKFKEALSDIQLKKHAELIDKIEKNSQLLYHEIAREFLIELTTEQYKLAERILVA